MADETLRIRLPLSTFEIHEDPLGEPESVPEEIHELILEPGVPLTLPGERTIRKITLKKDATGAPYLDLEE
jgi:hypothetical protein